MLEQRLITALVLGALAAGGILWLPQAWFGVALIGIALAGAWEWGRLLALSWPVGRIGYCLLVLVVMVLALRWVDDQVFLFSVFMFSCGYWCVVLIWLGRYLARPERRASLCGWSLAGLVTLTTPWVALMGMRAASDFGSPYVLFLVMLIWVADSGAYFAGRLWGRRKLVPLISPGKTWAGVYGALGGSLLFALGGGIALGVTRWPWFVAVCMVTVVFAIVGDLFESMLKRQHGAKDSGSLLPGHGGILDRVDSLTAAAPVFAAGLWSLSP